MTDVLHYAAFTDDPAGGNPAGVVLDAGALGEADMLRIAADVGYSETAFVTAGDDETRRYDLRYFTPRIEVAFCGHATVATAVALARRHGPGALVFTTPAGEIPLDVTEDGGTLRATLTSVATRTRPAEPAELAAALKVLRWADDDLDPAFPPHVAFAGNDHLMLAARSRERLADLDYDFDGLAGVMRERGWTTVHLFWREDDTTFHARDPFPNGGLVEDPATGAAAAAFGGYLRALGLARADRITVRQGEDMGRPSRLLVTLSGNDDRVRVSGQAVEIPPSPR
ncbi:PhzF family phenazine biosynthesis protein [Prauserella shujinwangii]|uniref:PhzF family phenazine biosynthesis protein n=1 Tax=Prauserella shujinwangii TaxID=1453103 RepID=A0A2T0LTP3_9PSEU|nr:PhzF family phenazine biosynthesis isomerase [Prauserella shujinwangii]PRX47073.1 PhzF family phenazine biosynthesis protein [Prauserella shujinwangii]